MSDNTGKKTAQSVPRHFLGKNVQEEWLFQILEHLYQKIPSED